MSPPDWMTPGIIAAGFGLVCGALAGFLAINLGLRLIPAGRAFLDAARAEGRMLAHPTTAAPQPVKLVFALGALAGAAAALAGYALFHEHITRPAWPIGHPVALAPGPRA